MLETIREFALERLAEAGEMDDARRRHADVILAPAEALEPQLASSTEALDAMTHDHDNLRAALSWSIETGEAETGFRLGYAAWRFWQRRGHFREARSWFDRMLALPGADAPTGGAGPRPDRRGRDRVLAERLRHRARPGIARRRTSSAASATAPGSPTPSTTSARLRP